MMKAFYLENFEFGHQLSKFNVKSTFYCMMYYESYISLLKISVWLYSNPTLNFDDCILLKPWQMISIAAVPLTFFSLSCDIIAEKERKLILMILSNKNLLPH